MGWRAFALGLACNVLVAVASAATLTLTATPVFRFSESFDPLPLNGTTDPGIYQVDLAIAISDLAANERGFGGLAFTVDFDGLTDTAGWQPRPDLDPCQMICLPEPPIPSVVIPPGLPADHPLAKLGQPGPDFIGSFFPRFDGVGVKTMTIENLLFLTTDLSGGINPTPQPAVGTSLTFGVVPEPATWALVASMIVAATFELRRRQ